MSDKPNIDRQLPTNERLHTRSFIVGLCVAVVSFTILGVIVAWTRSIPAIAANQDTYLGLTVPSALVYLFILLGFSWFIDIANPWFNFSDLMSGSDSDKRTGAIIFVGILVSISLVIMGCR